MALLPISDAEFQSQVLDHKGYVLLDFWAEWCGPCKMLMPVLEAVSADRTDIKFVKLSVDDNEETPKKFGVRGIPHLVLFKDGQVVAQKIGGASRRPQIDEFLERHAPAAQ